MTDSGSSNPSSTDSTKPNINGIARYYTETRWHYRGLWTGRNSLALHYGYWDDRVKSHTDSLHRLNEVLADKVNLKRGDTVLDAGCGWGGTSIWLVQHRGALCQGITLGWDQADKAREKAHQNAVQCKAVFSVQDYHSTAFRTDTFDVVWATESVCHSPDKPSFCREAYRVLKPGGQIVVSDYFRTSRPLSPPQNETLLRNWVSQWVVHDLATIEEFSQALASSGFTAIAITDATEHIRPSSERMFRTGLLTGPLALLFRAVGLHTEIQHRNWKSTLLQYRALRRGLWKYGIVTATKPDR